MDPSSKIKELLRGVVGTDKTAFNFRLMTVTRVAGDLCSATIDGGLEIPGIRLASIPGGAENGVLITPTVGSVVVVADLSAGTLRELMVVGYSEIEAIRVHKQQTSITIDGEAVGVEVGGSRVQIKDGEVRFNDGQNQGLVKVQQLTQRLNILEEDLNAIKTALTGWIPANALETDASALKLALTAWSGSSLAKTTQDQLENKEVKH